MKILAFLPLSLCLFCSPVWSQQKGSPHGELKEACATCHNPTSWTDPKFFRNYDHAKTGFPLWAGHDREDCKICHENLVFNEVGKECRDCHTDIHRSQLNGDCSDCHGTVSWDPRLSMPERHQHTWFPLLGAHAQVDCVDCHDNQQRNEFALQPDDCIGCHLEDYRGAQEPNHVLAQFDTQCESCHAPFANNWSEADFVHPGSFPLVDAHGGLACSDCHAEGYINTPTDCVACHLEDYNATTEPNHTQAGISTDCMSCHDAVAWQPARFDHEITGFSLTGGHNIADCNACHEDGFANTSSDCISCHEEDYNTVVDPNHVTAGFSTNCEDCHDTNAWTPAFFDHNQTQFPLVAAHAIDDCQACHEQGYTNTPTDCLSCHEQDYNNAADPNHVASGFPTDCEQCHTDIAWEPATFDHSQTQFPLTGAHAIDDCSSCHENGFNNTPTDCIACHQQDYNATVDPDHQASGFSVNCENCHSTIAWEPAEFDHSQTQFPLTGAHAIDDCQACHESGFNNTPTDCIACHQQDYSATVDPNHQASGFSVNCENCHSTIAWQPAIFDHSQTQFPLTGAHAIDDCLACHADGYTNTPTDCISCHQEDYDGTTDPNHVQSGFPTDCETCHTTIAWEPATFDHNQTQFPLTGAHAGRDCQDCHADGYVNTPTDCVACHQEDFDGADDPNHIQAGFSTDCEICHTTVAWEPATFDHNQTQFPLTGAHVGQDCEDCHADGYNNTPTDCVACHQADFDGAEDPNHVEAGFPTDCETCHTTVAWEPATFDHNQTAFPLTGAHTDRDCQDCHADGYTNTPTDCVACHQEDFNNADDPNHVEAGFPTDCESCHTTVAWEPATFDHNQTQFPLTGAHIQLDCQECHADGYANTPTDCIACHETEYNQAEPDHPGGGFPTDCTVCHNTFNWEQVNFIHSFPIFSGSHRDEWDSCAECHVVPNNYQAFECITCHEHNREDMDDEHRGISDYVYQSQACLNCHPDGEE